MDLISSILQGIRVEAPLLTQMQIGRDVTIDMEHAAGAPFHFVIEGTVQLLLGEHRRILSAGDVAMLPAWDRYSLVFGAGSIPQPITEIIERMGLPQWSERHGLDGAFSIDIGSLPSRGRILSGIVGIRPKEAGLLTAALPPLLIFRGNDPALAPTLQVTTSLLMRELEKPEPGFASAAGRSLELLFVLALREWLLRTEHPPGLTRGIGHPTVRRALEAMHGKPGEQWSLRDLAATAGQSRSAFAKTFVETTGEKPFAHLRRLRMHRAAVMLRTSQMSISEIGSEVGYSNTSAFRRAFEKQMDSTASAYRRSHREPPENEHQALSAQAIT